jgi:RNA polymerase sigma-70 factor (ECF subfamily)
MQLAPGVQPISSLPDPVLTGMPPGNAPRALERAFDQHHTLVYRTAYRVTGNAADAEDVLQTVFLRLAALEAQRAGQSQPENSTGLMDNPESYLRRAAVNAAINVIERRSRRNIPLEDAPEPRAQSDHADLRDVLRRAMATLGARTAEMFALRFLEGQSNGEIAEMFGVSTVSVAVTLHRARKQLQKEIQKLGGVR